MRIREIDGLRAVAVSSVVLYHWTPNVPRGGFIGVDLFFVISGFVITRGLLLEVQATRRIALGDFYARRFFRIFPPLAAMVSLFAVVLGYDRPAAMAAMFSFMNWYRATGHVAGLFGHAWSLSAEEQFYLLWPLCCGLLLRRGGMRKALVAAIIAAAAWRVVAVLLFGGTDRIFYGPDTRFDGLLLGCLLATFKPINLGPWSLFPAGGYIAFLFFAHLGGKAMIALPMLNICSAGLIIAAVSPTPLLSRVLTLPPVQWVGTRSYAIYLWHMPIGGLLPPRNFAGYLACLVLTIAAAELSMQLIELPSQRFGRRFTPRRIEGPARAAVKIEDGQELLSEQA